MSIGMMIRDPETGKSVLEPVSTQDVYSRVWVRGGMVLGLNLIPSFDGPLGCGVTVNQDTIDELSNEFESLKLWLESQVEPPYEFGFLHMHIGFMKKRAYRNWQKDRQYVLNRLSRLQNVIGGLKQRGTSFQLDIG